jgi:hypothetical protein
MSSLLQSYFIDWQCQAATTLLTGPLNDFHGKLKGGEDIAANLTRIELIEQVGAL